MNTQQVIHADTKTHRHNSELPWEKLHCSSVFSKNLEEHPLSTFTIYCFLQEADITAGKIFPIQSKYIHFNPIFGPALRMHFIDNMLFIVMLKI